MGEDISLYVHYPFCGSKCPYCDFNSYRVGSTDVNSFLEAYTREITHYSEILGNRVVNTVFFGGGTPSLMSANFLGTILNTIDRSFRLVEKAEISLEANPTKFESGKFEEFRSLGVNRLSIGVQSMDNQNLKFLGRSHGRGEILKAIDVAQERFGDRYSIDMIYALPEQRLQKWLKELNEATILSPNHLSLYQLTIEPETEFHRRGVKSLEEEEAAEMYRVTGEFLESRGIHLYEISNYAREGYECHHNLNYWNSGEWLGIGAGAHSRLCFDDRFAGGYRLRSALENIKNPLDWQRSVMKYGHGSRVVDSLSREEFIEEILLMGLRLRSGIALENVKKYLALGSGGILELLAGNYEYLVEKKYIEVSNDGIRVSPEHLRILDSILERIL
ncbi:MAG: radical SAM family heme chaperone HemW [Rickettsiales bacterium]|nr:radical SAM family heme chaperone HemW [Rickettsiales bacterium]